MGAHALLVLACIADTFFAHGWARMDTDLRTRVACAGTHRGFLSPTDFTEYTEAHLLRSCLACIAGLFGTQNPQTFAERTRYTCAGLRGVCIRCNRPHEPGDAFIRVNLCKSVGDNNPC